MKNFILLIIAIGLCINCIGQKKDTIYAYNGTYNSPTNQFNNDNYIRVRFLNDTIFTFAIIENYSPSPNDPITKKDDELRYNQAVEFGIARLVNYKGTKCWIGINDQTSSYIKPSNGNFLTMGGSVDFDKVLKVLENPDPYAYGDSEIKCQVYEFLLSKNLILMKGIKGISRFFEIGNYHKIDNNRMLFDIDPSDTGLKFSHRNDFVAVIKKTTPLISIPIQEKVPENKPINILKEGEKVYMTVRVFMKYTFVVQFDQNDKVIKYGWVLRDNLQKQ